MLSKVQMVKRNDAVMGKNSAGQERTVPIARESYQNRIQTILAEPGVDIHVAIKYRIQDPEWKLIIRYSTLTTAPIFKERRIR
jgi:ABC-type transport system involved in cytochrome c biogenesis ATPase subunit